MSKHLSYHNLIQQLSIGNVVNLGIYLYRSHLKLYFKLALIAHLWLLVPIYGWAKFYATSALISRLAFSELIGQPESLKTARIQINRQLWNFLITSIFVLLIPLTETLISFIVFAIIGGIIVALIQEIFGINYNYEKPNSIFFIVTGILVIATYLSPLWFYSRLFITDLPLAIDNKISSFQTIKQSRQLTKGFRKRLLGIILLSFLIALPVVIFSWYFSNILLGVIVQRFSKFYQIFGNDFFISTLLLTFFSLGQGIITMPFWQSIKAVVYYEIRCRRDGLDLKLPNRDI